MKKLRRIPCDHDKVYSGQINLSRKYAFICRHCGECGWDTAYDIRRVNADEYHALRVVHGWHGAAAIPRLPSPPRIPTRVKRVRTEGAMYYLLWLFGFLLCVCLGAFSVDRSGTLLVGAGTALGWFTVCFVAWKKGF